jgi:uncharacterized protein YukE
VSDIFTDVQFNFGAAFSAVTTIQVAATELESILNSRQSDLHTLTAQWEGGKFRAFNGLSVATQLRASAVVDQLRALARQIEQAASAARSVQDKKLTARREHYEQIRREEAAQAALAAEHAKQAQAEADKADKADKAQAEKIKSTKGGGSE